jgi:signal transduction histidine kinase
MLVEDRSPSQPASPGAGSQRRTRLSLRLRIFTVLGALVIIAVGGGLVSLWHTYMMDRLFAEVLDVDVGALMASQEIENAIVMQKGYITYYSQDADPKWLNRLTDYNRAFDVLLRKARRWAVSDKERRILNEIDSQYIRFSYSRDQVLDLYKQGKNEQAFELHKTTRGQLFAIIDLCRSFRKEYEARINAVRTELRRRARFIDVTAMVALVTAVLLAVILGSILFKQVLRPIRQLALQSDHRKTDGGLVDEVTALSQRFQNLIDDVDQTKSKLKWSREHLQQAEKWALVGKLAAGVAHSVRNPLTSVKMRLFSMQRSLALSPSQKEDVEVISEEIRHIDTIVNNFLEFSRPPKLKTQKTSPSEVVDLAIQLLRHRLESYDATVKVHRQGPLPEIFADPDQLKEVFVNLMVNACEAMVNGGRIDIYEEVGHSDSIGQAAVIRVTDNGPGVPDSIQEKLFQPFFSTKEEGTGLGLSIATRIVEEHGGWIDLKSREGEGATFIITLPTQEVSSWETS